MDFSPQTKLHQAFQLLDKEQAPDLGLLLPHKKTNNRRRVLQYYGNSTPTSPSFSSHRSNTFLAEISPHDSKWDEIRLYADKFSQLYKGTVYDQYSERIDNCSRQLGFVLLMDLDTGEAKFRLNSAKFCRVPRCPVCQWRRSMMWRAKAFKILPKLFEDYPDARYLFLTLTVRNCELTDLRSTLADMNAAWQRLSQRKQFPAIGFIKSVEVTRSEDDKAHPHFHCLLMVKPSYFQGKYYLSQKEWTELWRKSLRIDYTPIVHVQAIREYQGNAIDFASTSPIINAVLETIKYSVKPADISSINISDQRNISNQDWLIELTKQLYKTKALATGGLLKDYLKILEDEPVDLIHADNLVETEEEKKSIHLMFEWNAAIKRYTNSAK